MKPYAYELTGLNGYKYLQEAQDEWEPSKQDYSSIIPLYSFHIKPMEWVVDRDGDLTAHTPFGLFEVMYFGRKTKFVFLFKLKTRSHHKTLEEAKAAAEKYYAALIAELLTEPAT